MSNFYIPKFFAPEELVDEKTYELFEHNPELIYRLFDPNILQWADWMRDKYGPMKVNDWSNGGPFSWRGLRNPNAKRFYSPTSMHSHGQALDLEPRDYTAREIIDDLRKRIVNVPYVTRIEDEPGMTWIHGDTKITNKRNTHFFKP